MISSQNYSKDNYKDNLWKDVSTSCPGHWKYSFADKKLFYVSLIGFMIMGLIFILDYVYYPNIDQLSLIPKLNDIHLSKIIE